MANCKRIKRLHRKVCDGALQDLIEIYIRNITTPEAGGVDFNEQFTLTDSVNASIETTRGVTIFDSTNLEVAVSHTLYIRYIDYLTAEYWIKFPFDNIYLNILDVEDLENRHEYQKLLCVERGGTAFNANFA